MSDAPTLDQLPARLGFDLSLDALVIRDSLVEALRHDQESWFESSSQANDLWIRFGGLCDEAADRTPDATGRLGCMITLALVRRDGGLMHQYVIDLYDARYNAAMAGDTLTEQVIDQELDRLRPEPYYMAAFDEWKNSDEPT